MGGKLALLSASLGGAAIAVSCSSSDASESPQCIAVARDCAPLYEPTYEALFSRTLNPSCGVAGSSCHQSGGRGAQGGLTFDSPGSAYGILMDSARTWRLVDPSNPECSKLVFKITTHDPNAVMPPGRPLSPAEQCGIVAWVAKGAPR